MVMVAAALLVVPKDGWPAGKTNAEYTTPGTQSIALGTDPTSQINVTLNYTISSGAGCTGNNDTAPTIEVQWQTTGSGWGSPSSSGSLLSGTYTPGSTYTINGLNSGTTYDVRVIYTDSDGIGSCGGTSPSTVTASPSSLTTTANNSTTTGALTSPTQGTNTVDLVAAYSGDDNTNNSVTFEYSLAGQASGNPVSDTTSRVGKPGP